MPINEADAIPGRSISASKILSFDSLSISISASIPSKEALFASSFNLAALKNLAINSIAFAPYA